jgi:hypothetical protein
MEHCAAQRAVQDRANSQAQNSSGAAVDFPGAQSLNWLSKSHAILAVRFT